METHEINEQSIEQIAFKTKNDVPEDITQHVYDLFLVYIYNVRRLGFALTGTDSQIYYKIRHNLFQTAANFALGLPNTGDTPFTTLAMASTRTPDVLYHDFANNRILVVEFTVTNQAESALKNKQGFSKYDTEVNELRSRGFIVIYEYVSFVLSESYVRVSDQLYWICKKMGFSTHVDIDSIFEQLYSHVNESEWDISCWFPELLQFESEQIVVDLGIPQLEGKLNYRLETKTEGSKSLKDSRTMSYIVKFKRQLLAQIKSKPVQANLMVLIDQARRSCSIIFSASGTHKHSLATMVNNVSAEVLKYVTYTKSSDDLSPKMYQKVDFSPDSKLFNNRVKMVREEFDDSNLIRLFLRESSMSDVKTLSDMSLDAQIPNVKKSYLSSLKKMYLEEADVLVEKVKNPLFFPPTILRNGKPSFEPESGTMMHKLINRPNAEYFHPQDKVDRDEDFAKIDKLNTVVYRLGKQLKDRDWVIFNQCKRIKKTLLKRICLDEEHYNLALKYREATENYHELLETTSQHFKNKYTASKKEMEIFKQKEMKHYQKNHSLIEIMPGAKDVNSDILPEVLNKIDVFYKSLYSFCDGDVDKVYSSAANVGKGSLPLLDNFKEIFKTTYGNNIEHTLLMSSFMSWARICYSLYYYSSIRSSKNEFFLESCGTSNVLLLVKGGKKILSTKKSRLFQIVVETTKEAAALMSGSSTQIVSQDGRLYCVYPWRELTLAHIKFFMELPYRFSCFSASALCESNLSLEEFQLYAKVKILACFSQKRKLEIWLGFFRYIYFNSFSTHTCIEDLVKSMAMNETDVIQFTLQRSFLTNYEKLVASAKQSRLLDLFGEFETDNMDLCAEKFDEAIFMTKAPFNQKNEYMKNIRSILEIHKGFDEEFGTFDPMEVHDLTAVSMHSEGPIDDLFKSDHMYSPDMCFALGSFAARHLSSVTTKTDLVSKFNSILSRDFSEIGTSKAMRTNDPDIWGKKGNIVVSEDLKYSDLIIDTFENWIVSPSDYYEFIEKHNISFAEKAQGVSTPFFFDVSNKAQWKGSRETYTMDMDTKLRQNSMEKMFRVLCKSFPNELIHKPSSVRPKIIHSMMFESDDLGVPTYITLDCSKWAPKANLWKYYYFVKGMSGILPENFVSLFNQIWSLMMTKRIYVKPGTKKSLESNSKTAELSKYLTLDDNLTRGRIEKSVNKRRQIIKSKKKDKKSLSVKDLEFLSKINDHDFLLENYGVYYFSQPFNFVMGIWGDLSSLMHAASQLYFSESIATRFGATFTMMAHSDDSGGKCVSKSYETNLKVLKYYEYWQKCFNHVLSRKKSGFSEHSFELISIMYHKKRYIPMTHKFLYNIAIEVSGNGWYTDICNVVSKVIAAHSNGATLYQCYMILLLMNRMYSRFYHLPDRPERSSISLHIGGVYQGNPLHLVMLGPNAQEVLLDECQSVEERTSRIHKLMSLTGGYLPGRGSDVKYKLPYYIRDVRKLEMSDDAGKIFEAYSKLNYKDTFTSQAKFYSQLTNNNFIYSLNGLDSDTLLTASLFYMTKIVAPGGHVPLKTVVEYMVSSFHFKSDDLEGVSYPNAPETRYSSYLHGVEQVKIDPTSFSLQSIRSCKPLFYDTIDILGMRANYTQVSEVQAVMHDERIKNIFYKPERIEVYKEWMVDSLPNIPDSEKQEMLKHVSKNDFEKTRCAYLFLPSGVSIDTPERFVSYNVHFNSFRYRISKAKVQYHTPGSFQAGERFDTRYKHLYFGLEIMKTQGEDYATYNDVYDTIKVCSCCSDEVKKNSLKFLEQVAESTSGDRVEFCLPVVTYIRPQRRSKTVWYSSADFVIHGPGFRVSHTVIGSKPMTRWEIESEEHLKSAYQAYLAFTGSRGIDAPNIVRSITPISTKMVAFTDMWNPVVTIGDRYEMVYEDSTIQFRGSISTGARCNGSLDFTLQGSKVDYSIIHVYDINSDFYKNHGFEKLHERIFGSVFTVSKEIVINGFPLTHANSIINADPLRSKPVKMTDLMTHSDMLSSDFSFTRALCEGTKAKLTDYRSSANPSIKESLPLESVSSRDLPVMDLFPALSLLRLTWPEYKALTKLRKLTKLSEKDISLINRVRDKLGITGSMSSLQLLSDDFAILHPSQLQEITDDDCINMICSIYGVISKVEIMPNQIHYFKYNTEHFKQMFALKTFEHKYSNRLEESIFVAKSMAHLRTYQPEVLFSALKEEMILMAMKWEEEYIGNNTSIISYLLNRAKRAGGSERLLNALGEDIVRARKSLETSALAKTHTKNITGLESATRFKKILGNYTFDESMVEDGIEEYDEEEMEDVEEDLEEREWLDEDDIDEDHMEKFGFREVRGVYVTDCFNEVAMNNLHVFAASPCCPFRVISDIDFVLPWMGSYNVTYPDESPTGHYIYDYPGNLRGKLKPDKFRSMKAKGKQEKSISYKSLEDYKKELDEKDKEALELETSKLTPEGALRKHVVKTLDEIGVTDKILRKAIVSQVPYTPTHEEILERLIPSLGRTKDFLKYIKKNLKTREARRDVVPGYNNILHDDKLKSELQAMFGPNYVHILTGTVRLTKAVRDNFIAQIRFIMSTSHGKLKKEFFVFCLSVLKEVVLTTTSDDWFVDLISEEITSIFSLINLDNNDAVIMPQQNTGLEMQYERNMDYAPV
jgi:hypothetical protein